LLEEIGGGFHHAHFFCDGDSDPLVQGDAVLFGEALARRCAAFLIESGSFNG
jgi:hypothetical protein